jgi:hypothetical protein
LLSREPILLVMRLIAIYSSLRDDIRVLLFTNRKPKGLAGFGYKPQEAESLRRE